MNWIEAKEAKLKDGQEVLVFDLFERYVVATYDESMDWFRYDSDDNGTEWLQRYDVTHIMILERPEVAK